MSTVVARIIARSRKRSERYARETVGKEEEQNDGGQIGMYGRGGREERKAGKRLKKKEVRKKEAR